MDSNSKCPNCGNSKRVSGGNAAEEYCTKCGYCFTKSDDDIPFGFWPEKDDYGLGSRIGKGKDWKKIAPRSKFLPDSNTYNHLKIKNLVEKYAAKIKHNETIVNKTPESVAEPEPTPEPVAEPEIEESSSDPFEGIKTEDIEDFAELFDTPPPSSDKEAFEMAKKIRKWVADGRPK